MTDVRRLRWYCRRGTLELDLLLTRYLESRYSSADTDEQKSFQTLLKLEDTQLLRYLIGDELPVAPQLIAIVQIIRGLPVEQVAAVS